MTVMTAEILLGWGWFGIGLLTVLVATIVAASARRGLSYWPATSVLALTLGMRSLYGAIGTFPPLSGWAAALHDPLPQTTLQGLVLGGCVWAWWLVRRQNAVDDRGVVDMDGVIHPTTPAQARRRVSAALLAEGEVMREHRRAAGEDEPG